MREIVTFSTEAVNKAFNDEKNNLNGKQSVNLPGFTDLKVYRDEIRGDSEVTPCLFLITRISDGKVFGASYNDSVYSYSSNIFMSVAPIEFIEVSRRAIIIDHYEQLIR